MGTRSGTRTSLGGARPHLGAFSSGERDGGADWRGRWVGARALYLSHDCRAPSWSGWCRERRGGRLDILVYSPFGSRGRRESIKPLPFLFSLQARSPKEPFSTSGELNRPERCSWAKRSRALPCRPVLL